MNSLTIGNLSLNCSFIIYCMVYIPQLIYNQKNKNLPELSLGLHSLFYLSFIFDFIYAFAHPFSWQYQVVSVIGFVAALIQHLQLLKWFIVQKKLAVIKLIFLMLVFNIAFFFYCFCLGKANLSAVFVIFCGTVARVTGLVAWLPQIIKNHKKKIHKSHSRAYLVLYSMVTGLDCISAWSLNWGWPNKIAAPVTLVFLLTILGQTYEES